MASLIVFNPISGKGQGKKQALILATMLRAQGEESQSVGTEQLESIDWGVVTKIIVVGGDGTLLKVLPYALNQQKPVCMYPAGYQCLFAREFNYPKDHAKFLARILRGQVEKFQVGLANDHPFCSMTSVGVDSAVIKYLDQTRKGPITSLTYPWATFKTLFSYRASVLTVHANGELIIDARRGYLIVGNNPQYALGLKMIPEAQMKSEVFAIRFVPCKHGLDFLLKTIFALLTGRWNKYPLHFAGDITVSADSKSQIAAQSDGDFIGDLPLHIVKSKQKLLVII
ncbi:MAG: NAD(+)/NADH kinase [Deltaproteobacteria bacterium]|nr:NAD(+)/NADH kinase [Deltaproteobacteria bacterium]